jgi:hypothetical protein
MPRRTISGLIDVVDSMTEDSIGHLGNLSVGGMLLIARAPLMEDGLYQLRFPLPDDEAPLEVGAQVMWQEAGTATGQAWIGLRFIGLAPAVTRRLREWTQSDETGTH